MVKACSVDRVNAVLTKWLRNNVTIAVPRGSFRFPNPASYARGRACADCRLRVAATLPNSALLGMRARLWRP